MLSFRMWVTNKKNAGFKNSSLSGGNVIYIWQACRMGAMATHSAQQNGESHISRESGGIAGFLNSKTNKSIINCGLN